MNKNKQIENRKSN